MGGAERRYWEIAKRLGKKHEIHFFTSDGDSNSRGITRFLGEEENFLVHHVARVPNIYNGHGRRTIYSALKFSANIIPSLAGYEFDVIDATFHPVLHLYPLKITSRFTRSPFICTVHDVWSQQWSEYFGNKIIGNMARCIDWVAMRLANKIIVVSKTSANQCIQLSIPKEKIAIIPNGVDTRYIKEVEPNSQERSSEITFVGRLVPYKGIDILLRATKLLKEKFKQDPRVNIIGKGPLKQHLLSLIEEFALAPNVKLLDRVDDYDELIRYLKSSKLFVLPSFREGFSIAAIEAMASGLPVITFDVDSNAAREHVTNFVNGFKVLPDARDLASSINNLLTQSDLRERMSRNAENYSSRYDWDRMITMLEKLYVGIAKKR
jgi:glycosyltransferase involved in cell wall biosynthesis